MFSGFAPGDPVIYSVTKQSNHPGPRARSISASGTGDVYTYVVDKFWRVKRIMENGDLLLVTRRGKEHQVNPADPLLKRPNLLQRWLLASRFPAINSTDHDRKASG